MVFRSLFYRCKIDKNHSTIVCIEAREHFKCLDESYRLFVDGLNHLGVARAVAFLRCAYNEVAGYTAAAEDKQTSNLVLASSLSVSQLVEGEKVAVEWNPNRRRLLHYLGGDLFEVIEARNSKIVVGDRFRCNSFTIGHPLYVSDYHHADNLPTPFVAGKKGGLTKIGILTR